LLGGSAKHVGFLNAFPNLFAALVQMKSADLALQLKSRKSMVSIFVFFQALTLLAMSTVALMGGGHPIMFIVTAVFYACFGALALPAWGSLMSDLVPADKRGEYFGWRNRNLGFILVGATFLSGLILHVLKARDVFMGFVIIFSVAFVCRLMSWVFLRAMEEPSFDYKREDQFTLFNFLARLKESNFARFVLFIAMLNFSVNLASPYFAVLMLKDLSFSYLLYTAINIFATVTVYLTMNRWGRHADKVGNLKIIKFTAPLIGMIPLLWIINRDPVFLLLAQIFSGFLWAGFNLCCSNFIYDAVTPGKRTRCIAYFNLFNGLALSAGALVGGFLIPHLPSLFGYKILTLLLISSLLRITVAYVMPVKLKEVRPIEKVSSNQLFFSMLGIKPILGVDRKTIRF
jgi:MFS family permease